MAKICTKVVDVENRTVTFDFANGTRRVIEADRLTQDLQTKAMMHGLSQKGGDSYASAMDVEEAIGLLDEVIGNLYDGAWAVRTGTGGVLAEALSRATGKALADCQTAVKGMDDTAKKALRAHGAIKKALAEIAAEKAARMQGGDAGDLEALFGSLPASLSKQAV